MSLNHLTGTVWRLSNYIILSLHYKTLNTLLNSKFWTKHFFKCINEYQKWIKASFEKTNESCNTQATKRISQKLFLRCSPFNSRQSYNQISFLYPEPIQKGSVYAAIIASILF